MTHPPLESYLSTQEFFSGLNPEFIEFLSRCANELQVEPNQFLFRPREHARHFYLIQSGQVAIEIPALMGPTLTVQTLGSGQILGWSWLIPPYQWNFQARTEEPTALIEFDGEAILAHCEENSQFGYTLMKRFASLMSERLEVARRRMMDQWNPPGFA